MPENTSSQRDRIIHFLYNRFLVILILQLFSYPKFFDFFVRSYLFLMLENWDRVLEVFVH